MMRCLVGLRGVVLAVGGIWMLTSVQAAPIASDHDAKHSSPAEKVRKALEENVSLDLADQDLTQAIKNLREQTKLNIVLDRGALMQMGISPEEMQVSVKLPNVKLRSGLRVLLSQCNLNYAIVGDLVVITTEELAIQRQARQRVNLDLKEVPLKMALHQLACETATNLVLDARTGKEGQTPVTLTLEDVPLETAVRLLAELAGLKPARIGNVFFVTTEARADKLRADPENNLPVPNPATGVTMPSRPGVQVDEIVPPVPPPVPPKK